MSVGQTATNVFLHRWPQCSRWEVDRLACGEELPPIHYKTGGRKKRDRRRVSLLPTDKAGETLDER
ncbi:MAG: hypothetical protein V1799_19235 [bacterium]